MKEFTTTEELDFHYLLTLMPALHEVSTFSWLPELFSIVGIKNTILLSKYAGGETITIPTMDELSEGILALQEYYDVLTGKKDKADINPELLDMVLKIDQALDSDAE